MSLLSNNRNVVFTYQSLLEVLQIIHITTTFLEHAITKLRYSIEIRSRSTTLLKSQLTLTNTLREISKEGIARVRVALSTLLLEFVGMPKSYGGGHARVRNLLSNLFERILYKSRDNTLGQLTL